MAEEMNLRVAIEKAEKFLTHLRETKRGPRPPTALEKQAIQRLVEHASPYAQ
jgi:hypothetical protein